MSELRIDLVSRLRRLARELGEVADAISQLDETTDMTGGTGLSSPDEPSRVAEAIAARQCLQCGRKLKRNEQYRRGLCTRHYQETTKRLDRGDVTEDALVAAGLLAKPRAPGRARETSALDAFLENRDRRTDADAEQQAERLAGLSETGPSEVKKSKPPTKRKTPRKKP